MSFSFFLTIIDFHFSKIGSNGEREERLVELTRRFTDMMEGKVRLMVIVVMMVMVMVAMMVVFELYFIFDFDCKFYAGSMIGDW